MRCSGNRKIDTSVDFKKFKRIQRVDFLWYWHTLNRDLTKIQVQVKGHC